MKKLINYLTIRGLLAMMFAIVLTGSAWGQKMDGSKRTDETKTANTNLANLQAGSMQPDGSWLNSREPSKNMVRWENTPTIPLPIKVEDAPVRKPFQKRVIVTTNGDDYRIVAMQIPTGKRLVIENVSVIVRCPQGRRMEVNYLTYLNNGTGVADRTLHRLALKPMGSINATAIFTVNDKERVFADEQIGAEHFSVGVSARLINSTAGYGQAQFTFSGYLEDLPPVQ